MFPVDSDARLSRSINHSAGGGRRRAGVGERVGGDGGSDSLAR